MSGCRVYLQGQEAPRAAAQLGCELIGSQALRRPAGWAALALLTDLSRIQDAGSEQSDAIALADCRRLRLVEGIHDPDGVRLTGQVTDLVLRGPPECGGFV